MTYAGFWFRTAAAIVDIVLLNLLALLGEYLVFFLGYVAYRIYGVPSLPTWWNFEDAFRPLTVQIVNAVIYLLICTPYYVIGHYRYATTLGKRIFRIEVLQAGTYAPITLKQSWIRCVGYLLSYVPVGCGFLMAAFQPEKRALHDLVAGTVSVRRPRRGAIAAAAPVVVLLLALGVAPMHAWADDDYSEPSDEHTEAPIARFQNTLSAVVGSPSARGVELQIAAMASPSDTPWVFGPRLGYLATSSSVGHRESASAGFESTLWLVNAVGVGLALDAVAPVVQPTGGNDAWPLGYRVEGFVLARVWHVGESGAIGFRGGILKDSEWGTSFRAGVNWEWSGIR